MDCIFSVAHDRWLVIRSNETTLCPIDNSSVKIRAAGKLYEPDTKYSRESLLNDDGDDDDDDCDDDDHQQNRRESTSVNNRNLVRFLDVDGRDDFMSNNHLDQPKCTNVRFAEDIDASMNNVPPVSPRHFVFGNESSGAEELTLKTSSDSLNENSNNEKIQLVLRTASDDTLDTLDEAKSESDIIPPPSDFATEMIPLRKSKSAPAPFKKAQKGATPMFIRA